MKKIAIGISLLTLSLASHSAFAAPQYYHVTGSSVLSIFTDSADNGWIQNRTSYVSDEDFVQNSNITDGVYNLKFTIAQSVNFAGMYNVINVQSVFHYDTNTNSGYLNNIGCNEPSSANTFFCSHIDLADDSSITSNEIVFNPNNPLQFTLNLTPVAGSSLTLNFNLVEQCSEVPLPAGAWLFGSALLGLGGFKRKKK